MDGPITDKCFRIQIHLKKIILNLKLPWDRLRQSQAYDLPARTLSYPPDLDSRYSLHAVSDYKKRSYKKR